MSKFRYSDAFGTFFDVAAGASAFSKAQIWNPAGSGIVVQILNIAPRTNTGLNYIFGFIGSALTTTNANGIVNTDSGGGAGQAQALEETTAVNPLTGAIMGEFRTGANVNSQPGHIIGDDNPILVRPGAGFIILNSNPNTATNLSVFWRELSE